MISKGLFFHTFRSELSSLLISTTLLKKFNINFYLLFLLLITPLQAEFKSFTGVGEAKLIGDPFNVALLARERAIINALEKKSINISSESSLSINNNNEDLSELITSRVKGKIEKWEEVESCIIDGNKIRSIIRIYIKDELSIEINKQLKFLNRHLKLSGSSNIHIRISELLKAYTIAKYLEKLNYAIEINSDRLIEEISDVLNSIQINNHCNTYTASISGKKISDIDFIKVPRKDENPKKNSFYLILNLGELNYKLLQLGLKVPAIEVIA